MKQGREQQMSKKQITAVTIASYLRREGGDSFDQIEIEPQGRKVSVVGIGGSAEVHLLDDVDLAGQRCPVSRLRVSLNNGELLVRPFSVTTRMVLRMLLAEHDAEYFHGRGLHEYAVIGDNCVKLQSGSAYVVVKSTSEVMTDEELSELVERQLREHEEAAEGVLPH